MSFRRAAFGFALPVSLALACAACGQGNQDQSLQNQPATGQTAQPGLTQTPMASSPMEQTPPGTGTTTQSPMMPPPATTAQEYNGMGGGNFTMLAGAKGYITKSDAMQDHWMNTHFTQCDSDQDGKVTQAEYETCHNPNGSAPPPSSAM